MKDRKPKMFQFSAEDTQNLEFILRALHLRTNSMTMQLMLTRFREIAEYRSKGYTICVRKGDDVKDIW